MSQTLPKDQPSGLPLSALRRERPEKQHKFSALDELRSSRKAVTTIDAMAMIKFQPPAGDDTCQNTNAYIGRVSFISRIYWRGNFLLHHKIQDIKFTHFVYHFVFVQVSSLGEARLLSAIASMALTALREERSSSSAEKKGKEEALGQYAYGVVH